MRPLEAGDHPAVLELIDTDRVPGQPGATEARLRAVLAGRSAVDGGWWAELTELRHDVAVHDGQVEADRSAALRLYRWAGFELVDRLHSYSRDLQLITT